MDCSQFDERANCGEGKVAFYQNILWNNTEMVINMWSFQIRMLEKDKRLRPLTMENSLKMKFIIFSIHFFLQMCCFLHILRMFFMFSALPFLTISYHQILQFFSKFLRLLAQWCRLELSSASHFLPFCYLFPLLGILWNILEEDFKMSRLQIYSQPNYYCCDFATACVSDTTHIWEARP